MNTAVGLVFVVAVAVSFGSIVPAGAAAAATTASSGTAPRPVRQLYINTSKTIDQLSFAMAHDSQTATALPDWILSNATDKALHAFAIDQYVLSCSAAALLHCYQENLIPTQYLMVCCVLTELVRLVICWRMVFAHCVLTPVI